MHPTSTLVVTYLSTTNTANPNLTHSPPPMSTLPLDLDFISDYYGSYSYGDGYGDYSYSYSYSYNCSYGYSYSYGDGECIEDQDQSAGRTSTEIDITTLTLALLAYIFKMQKVRHLVV